VVPLDAELLDRALDLARRARLRAYDAVYVAVASLRGVPLFTIDEEVRRRVTAHVPGIDVEPG
jgi:predicted nucleic acid-binding protein